MKLRAFNLGWLVHMQQQHDLCAHGAVEVQIGSETIENDPEVEWCVSAGALLLMRTLTNEHTDISTFSDQLIPCCGHNMYVVLNEQDVEIQNCSVGLNWEVRHLAEGVLLRTVNGAEEYVPWEAWQQIVFQFADTVEALYVQSLPKQPEHEYEAEAYNTFLAEWSRRRGKPFRGSALA